ncbi:MAG: universal stress protein, partial [Planctomycetes bacterium]|nr:universal stress protein [Planctomycetota bacterium]
RWALGAEPGGRRALSVVLALGLGKPTRVAIEAVKGLTKLGSCALTEVHVYDPLEEGRRRGLGDAESPEVRGQIEGALARELPPRLGQTVRTESKRFIALPSRGHVAETLTEFVEEESADLLVLGAHRHGALRRRFFGSVSYGVLAMVETNVLIVPPKAVQASPARPPRRVQRVLVATDLSEVGNRAVELALGLLPEGGQLVLLHVDVPLEPPSDWIMGYPPAVQTTPGERRMKRALAEGELEKLARSGGARALETQVEVVESSDVARAILEAAERHEVDLVCLGTHHYGRVTSALIGSVARTVARRSPRPVLLVPNEDA